MNPSNIAGQVVTSFDPAAYEQYLLQWLIADQGLAAEGDHFAAAHYRTFSPTLSGTLSVDGTPAADTIETSGDEDWFAVDLAAGQSYEFSLAGSGSAGLVDPYLELYDAGGTFLAADDDSGTGRDSLLYFTASQSGTYYLSASAFSYGTGDFTLGATASVATDDYADSTSTSASVAAGGSAGGIIERANDADWFRVDLSAGVTYTIRLRGEPSGNGTLADPYFEGVYDASGNYIFGTTNDDYGGSLDSRTTFTPATSGTYYLSAAAYGDNTGSYTLTLTGQAISDLAASSATTASVALGGTLRSTIDDAGDIDWVRTTLTAGRTYEIELNADLSSAGPLDDPLFVGVYDSAGVLISGTSNDDYGIGLNSRIAFTPTAGGTYYLAAGGYGESTGAYALRLLSTTTGQDDAGSDPAGAASLAVDTPQSGTINSVRDVDWYQVSLGAGQDYRIDVRGADSGAGTLADPELIGIYDAAGNIVPGTGNDNAHGTQDAQALFQPAAGGTYYVAVTAADDGTGSYTVSVQAVSASTDLPDNATTTATLADGAPLASDIGAPGDIDWVQVSLTAGTTYRFDMLGAPTGDGSLDDPLILGVYDASGFALPGSGDDDGGEGYNASVTLVAPATGTYYVAVQGYGEATGSYTLAMDEAEPDTTAPALLSTWPDDGSQDVSPRANLTLVFDEAVLAGSGNLTISGGGTTLTIDIADAQQVSFRDTALTINPAADLADNTDYTVTLDAGAVTDLAGNAFAGIDSATQFNFSTGEAGALDCWTVIIYVAGDNDLEPFAIDDVNEMESVVLPDNVNVVVLLDRGPGYDTSNGNWTGTRTAVIGNDGDTATLGSSFVSIGEQNTGDGATLTAFIDNAAASQPASHYALIVWNHGGGLSGTAWDDSSGNDNLTLPEMLAAVDASSVAHFDFIGFDACLQGMLEQAWDLRNQADVVVASQELEPGDGWEYQDFLGALAADPDMNAYDLAQAAVDAYGDRYAGEDDTTLSAIRSDALAALKTALNGFAAAAIGAGAGAIAQLLAAAQRTTELNDGDNDYRDLGDFMNNVLAEVSNAAVTTAANNVLAALSTAVLTHVGTVSGANGLSIYLPLNDIDASYATQSYSFLQGTSWGNFLRFMLDDQRDDNLGGDATGNDIRGFDGDDTLAGGAGNDTLSGGDGNDSLAGGSGTDTASYDGATAAVSVSLTLSAAQNTGGAGSDTLAGIENLVGSAHADTLTGSAVRNVLRGGAGNDSLAGGGGNDLLVGGAGQDQLTGGAGRDAFDFNTLAETGLVGDLITDFASGEDRIDLATLDADAGVAGNQAFSFIGTAAFSAAGQVRFDATAHMLYGSTDADIDAEFAIQLGSVTTLASADLVL